MNYFCFTLITNESPDRNPEDPFEWEMGDLLVPGDDMEMAIRYEVMQLHNRHLNELTEYDLKRGVAIYENAHDGSYLTFKVRELN